MTKETLKQTKKMGHDFFSLFLNRGPLENMGKFVKPCASLPIGHILAMEKCH